MQMYFMLTKMNLARKLYVTLGNHAVNGLSCTRRGTSHEHHERVRKEDKRMDSKSREEMYVHFVRLWGKINKKYMQNPFELSETVDVILNRHLFNKLSNCRSCETS